MSTLGGHRGNFTWALNKYNSTDDPVERERFARHLAKYLQNAQADGFSADTVTQGQSYPADEVKKYLGDAVLAEVPEVSEAVVNAELAEKIDMEHVTRVGAGDEIVYAYGYKCLPDRLKIGMTTSNCVQRIVQQINESTPEKPVLYIEMKTARSRTLERALHSVLDTRGKKISGGGYEWFNTTVAEVLDIYNFVTKGQQ
jgi:hypothetical protein